MTKCVSVTKLDKKLFECDVLKEIGFTPFVVATFRAMYEAKPATKKGKDFQLDENDMESIIEYATILKEDVAKRMAQNAVVIKEAHSNAAIAYKNLLDSYKGEVYPSTNHDKTKFSPSAIIKQRASWMAQEFSNIAQELADEHNAKNPNNPKTKFDIIQGFKTKTGRPIAGEDIIFKKLYQKILDRFLKAKEGSVEQREYGKVLQNWGTLCMLSRAILRRKEGIKLGAYNNYGIRVEDETIDAIIDGFDLLDIEESHKESWMERKDRIFGFTSLGKEVRSVLSSIPKIAYHFDPLQPDHPYIYNVQDDLGNEVMIEPLLAHDILTDLFRGMPSVDAMMRSLEYAMELPQHLHNVPIAVITKARIAEALYNRLKNDPILQTKFFVNYKKGFTAYTEISFKDGKFKTVSLNQTYSTGEARYSAEVLRGVDIAQEKRDAKESVWRKSIFSIPIGGGAIYIAREEEEKVDPNAKNANKLIDKALEGVGYTKDPDATSWSSEVRKIKKDLLNKVKTTPKKRSETEKQWKERHKKEIESKEQVYQKLVDMAALFGIEVDSYTLGVMQLRGTLDKFISSVLYLCDPKLRQNTKTTKGILAPQKDLDGKYLRFYEVYNTDSSIAKDFKKKIRNVYKYIDDAQSDSNQRRARIMDKHGKPTTVFSDQLPCFLTDTLDTIKNFANTNNQEGFEEYVSKKYFESSYFYEGGLQSGEKIDPKKIKNIWLRQMYENFPDTTRMFDHHRFAQMDIRGKKISFENLSEKHHTLALLQQFNFSGGTVEDRSYSYYPVFILGDSGVARFIKAPRYSSEDVVEHYFTVFEQEKQLYKQLKQVDKHLKEGTNPSGKKHAAGFKPAQNYNYQTLSFLGTKEQIEQLMSKGPKEVKEAIKSALDKKVENFKKKLQQEGLLKVTPAGEGNPGIYKELGTLPHFNGKVDIQKGILITEENIDDYLKQFVYNYSFAMTQQMQLMTVSPNFYKHTEELQKRYKEIHASGTPLDINARFPNGEKVFTRVNPKTGKKEFYPYEVAVYFDDMLINSEVNHPDFIKLVEKKSKGAYSSYLKNTLTDGQSYRSIDSYRKIAIAQGLWDLNGNEEKLYQKLQYHRQTGKKLTPKDLKDISQLAVVLQPQKPYLYTFENFRYKDNDTNTEDTVKISVQHKCAEVILIPELLPQNSSLRHLAEAMNKNQIDVVCSTEVVKVGEFGATAIDYKTNEDGLYINSMGEVLPGKEGGEIPLNRADQRKHPNFNKVVDGIENPSKYQPVSFLSNETMSPVDAFSVALSKGYKHELSLETYYRQQNVPEHIHDSRNMGTQLRKVFLDGLTAAGDYTGYLGKRLVTDKNGKKRWVQPTEVNIGGKMYDLSKGNGGRNIARFYNSLIVANLMRSFDALLHEIGDNQKLSQALQQMIINSSESTYYSLMNFALTGDGDFLTPLYESCNEHDASSKIISLFKKKVQQQKMLGGSAVQASAFGIEDVVKDSHMPNDGGLGYEYEYDEEGNVTNIKWMECEIPFDFSYTDALGNQVQLVYEDYVYTAEDEAAGLGKEGTPKMTEDGKSTLIEKDFPGILNMIAYRIPTERAYSVMNLKIKRFSRKENGGIIRVPAEGTTIAGFDFDIDKLYFLRKEFVARKTTDIENARLWGEAYKKNPHIKQELLNAEALLTTPGSTKILPKISGFIETIFGEDIEEKTRIEAKDKLYEYWEQAKLTERTGLTASQFFSRYAKFDAPKVFEEYDYNKDATENSTVQCNNEILNLMWNRMADPETLEARITPGGFPNASKAAKTNRILTTPEYAKKVASNTEGEITLDNDQLYSMVNDKDNDYKVAYDVTDPLTLIYYNQQNQIAGTLIGVFANHNSNHMFTSLAEQMTISHTFKLCGHSFNDLIKAPEGRNPSLTIAEFLASSVDAVKDPVLNYLNLNKNTANAGALLARLGYNAEEIGLLFNQPIIKQICERVANDIYLDLNTAIQEVIKEWDLKGDDISKVDLTKDTMMKAIASHTLATSEGKQTTDEWITQNKKSQALALQIFSMVSSYASELSDFVSTTKYSAAGSMGSTWGSLFNLKYATEKYMKDAENKKQNPKTPHLNIIAYKDKNADHLGIESLKYDPDNKLEYMDYVMSNPFAFEQCEYDMLTSFMDNLCGNNSDRKGLFPYSTLMYRTIRDTMNDMTKSEVLSADTIDTIHEDILVALLSSMKDSDFDGNKKIPVGDKIMTQKKFYTEHFADVMLDLFNGKSSSIDPLTITSLKDWLYIQYDSKNEKRFLRTRNLSSHMKSSKEDFTILWESLATSDSQAERDLAVSLFLYCFHNFGYEFTPNNFIHNAPEAVKNLAQVISYSTKTEQIGVHTYSDFLNDIMNPDSFYIGHIKSSGKTDISTATMVRNFIKMYIQNHTEEYSLVYTPKRDAEVKSLDNAVKKLEKDSEFVYIELNKKAEKEPWYHKLVMYNSEEQGTKVMPAFVLNGKLYECVNLNENLESLTYNVSKGQASIVIYREVPILGEEKRSKSYTNTMTHEEIESVKLYSQMEQAIAKIKLEEAKANFDPSQVNHDRTYMNGNREQQPHC